MRRHTRGRHRIRARAWVVVSAAAAWACASSTAAEYPVDPYVVPSHLYDIPPWAHSHYKQPWRAWMETTPGVRFLDGIGINYQVPRNHRTVVAILASHGFRKIRLEIGGGNLAWDGGLLPYREQYYHDVLEACGRYRVRPLILLNNHQGAPCPLKGWICKVSAGAAAGDRVVQLDSLDGIVIGRTGLSSLSQYMAAEALITATDPSTNTVTLSKPLPVALAAGASVPMHALKWLPLSEVGTPEFEETADYWVQYADTVCEFVASHGVEFDIEIWNELTLGSQFLNIDNYYEPDLVGTAHDPLRPGGRCWELARRITERVHSKWPDTRCVWGFSNITFFHTKVSDLPRGTDAQSYHPYGTALRQFPADEYMADRPWTNLEGYVPHYRRIMPEGIAHDLIQLESVMKLVNPPARQAHPAGVTSFEHWFTEHGWSPKYSGVTDPDRAAELKARMVLRAGLLFLNKGISRIYFFQAYEDDPLGGGLLGQGVLDLRPGPWPRFRHSASPAMQAMGNVTRAFARSRPLHGTRQLEVDVTKLSEPVPAFPGDAAHDPLWHRDVFAVLPYQTRDNEFVIAVYVMTRDFTVDMLPEQYRVTLRGIHGSGCSVTCYDPILDRSVSVSVESRAEDAVTIRCTAVDYPRLLLVREGGSPRRRR